MRRKKLEILLAATLLVAPVTSPLAEMVAADTVQQPSQRVLAEKMTLSCHKNRLINLISLL